MVELEIKLATSKNAMKEKKKNTHTHAKKEKGIVQKFKRNYM